MPIDLWSCLFTSSVAAAAALAAVATLAAAFSAAVATAALTASVATSLAAAPVTAALVAVAPFGSPAFGQIIAFYICMNCGVLSGGSGLQ